MRKGYGLCVCVDLLTLRQCVNTVSKVHYLKLIIAERQPEQRTIVKQMNRLIIVAFNRLQLPVAGTSDGNANVSSAALPNSYIMENQMNMHSQISESEWREAVRKKKKNADFNLRPAIPLEAIVLIAMSLNCRESMLSQPVCQLCRTGLPQECTKIPLNSVRLTWTKVRNVSINEANNKKLFLAECWQMVNWNHLIITSNPSINITLTIKMMEKPITSGHGSPVGAFRPSIYILIMPPVIESKQTLNVRVNAEQAQINVNISIHVVRNSRKKSNLWVARKYGSCK